MSRFVKVSLWIVAFAALGTPRPAHAQTPRPQLHAVRAMVPPKLDGVLDDEAWARAPLPLDGWLSYSPMRGEPAAEKTDVWIAYDDRAIYFAFHAFDSDPGRIRTTISRRDQVFADDWVGLSLDSSRSGQLAYHMMINPSGIQMDAFNSGSNGEDFAPDWVWQSAGKIGADGYVVEVRLPLEAIRFSGGTDVEMGVLFWRRVSRSGVSSAWPPLAPGKWVFETHAPLVFDELHPRRLLEVIPSATLANNQRRGESTTWGKSISKGSLGAAVKYGLTSRITLEATVNPDFSQVESDAFEVEVNNRFPVFFSEKRPFFMEGLGLFNLAGTGNDASMRTAVHTRRIIDPTVGIKLTGSSGRQTFAFLSAADASPGGDQQRVFTIGRDVLNFGQGQYVGLLLTDTELGSDHNRVIGGDGTVKRGDHFRTNGSFLYSHSQTPGGSPTDGVSATGYYIYNTRHVAVLGQIEHYDRDFRMDTSFINRVGMTRAWQYQEYTFYPDQQRHSWIKRAAPFVWFSGAQDRVQHGTEFYALPGIRFNFTRAASLRLDYGRGHETYAGRKFEVGSARAEGNIQLTRWLNIRESISRGPAIFYDPDNPFQGDRTSQRMTVELQPNAHLNSITTYNYVTFDNRSTGLTTYSVHVLNLKNIYQFTPRFFTRAIVQYDSSIRRVLTDLLASYELAPGTVAHAGYGSLFEKPETESYIATARAFFFKVSYRAHF